MNEMPPAAARVPLTTTWAGAKTGRTTAAASKSPHRKPWPVFVRRPAFRRNCVAIPPEGGTTNSEHSFEPFIVSKPQIRIHLRPVHRLVAARGPTRTADHVGTVVDAAVHDLRAARLL